MKNFLGHLKTILIHKWWVFRYCCLFGIPWRGLVHDLSKFSPTEFFESVKYYSGTRSPIDASKEANGYSRAWLHHKGRNKHHYEYWQDNFDNGGMPLVMPYKESLEMLCDYLGAARAYMGKSFTYLKELDWWDTKKAKPLAMHPININFITDMLTTLVFLESKKIKKNRKYFQSTARAYYDVHEIGEHMGRSIESVLEEARKNVKFPS